MQNLTPSSIAHAVSARFADRPALETVIRAGKMEPLHEAIQSLYKVEEDKADQAATHACTGLFIDAIQ